MLPGFLISFIKLKQDFSAGQIYVQGESKRVNSEILHIIKHFLAISILTNNFSSARLILLHKTRRVNHIRDTLDGLGQSYTGYTRRAGTSN